MINVAGRHLDEDKIVFTYENLSKIFESFGFKEDMKMPVINGFNLSQLDMKSIRIANRLARHMELNGMAEVEDFIGRQNIYSKSVKEDSDNEAQEVEFVRTKKFFNLLKQSGLKNTSQPHEKLLNFLSLEENIYN